MGLFDRLKQAFRKTREALGEKISAVFSAGRPLDAELLGELEEVLLTADVGVETTDELLDALKEAARLDGGKTPPELLLRRQIVALLRLAQGTLPSLENPHVILVVGVNGTGKTTTIGKLAHYYTTEKKSVVLAAADTFRAAATEQLEVWGQRVGCDVIKHKPGADPGAVIFDAIAAARARGAQMVIADTAGRLHTQRNLMEELKKIGRVAERALGRPADERLLVLDATTGQNALVQARTFAEAVGVTGIVITKLDGTAKGGTVIAIADATGLPIKLAGTGEKLDDLEDFDPRAYVEALFESA